MLRTWLAAGRRGSRCSSSRRCAGQANTTGSRHAFCQAPPCCCWMSLLSPARHCGQYRSRGGEHPRAGERPGTPLVGGDPRCRPRIPAGHAAMDSCVVSVAVSLVTRAEAPGPGASSRCSIRLRRARLVTVAARGEAGELHDAGRGQPEPVRQPQQVAGQGLIRQRVQAAPAAGSACPPAVLPVMIWPRSRSPGRGHRRRCCARVCVSWLRCRLTGRVRAGWRGSPRLGRRGCARRGG